MPGARGSVRAVVNRLELEQVAHGTVIIRRHVRVHRRGGDAGVPGRVTHFDANGERRMDAGTLADGNAAIVVADAAGKPVGHLP